MRPYIQITVVFFILICLYTNLHAQVAINEDSSDPDASAMLDISSGDKGLLIPRMDSTSRQDISSPANGLLIFDTDFNSFWYYTNSTWLNLNAAMTDADGDTKIQIEKNPDEDIIRFDLTGTEFMRLDSGRMEILNTGGSIIIGEDAGANDDFSGNNENVFIGREAGYDNTSGYFNVFTGSFAGTNNLSGFYNVFTGTFSGNANTTGYRNTFLGGNSGTANTTGYRNVFIGDQAGKSNATGNTNVFIGNNAGQLNTSGDANVFLGYQSGYNETSSNKLYIENSDADSTQALIYGDFEADSLQINGQLGIYGAYRFPTTDGNANQILTTNGSGTLSWADFSNSFSDADGDTNIEVEQDNDDDIIRFNLGGTEFMRLDSGRIEILNTGNSVFIGEGAGANDELTNANIFIGGNAGNANTEGYNSVAIGTNAAQNATNAFENVSLGYAAARNMTSGAQNVAIGFGVLENNETGGRNTVLGFGAGQGSNLHNKSQNVIIGYNAGLKLESNANTILGYQAGFNTVDGTGNVFLGYNAGYNSRSSNKLYIENTSADSTTALIYGDFDADSLQINGKLNINGAFAFPTTDGTANQVLVTDGSGSLNWTDVAGDQTLSFENDSLTISNGNAIDLSELRTIDSDGLTIVTEPTSVLDVEQASTNAFGGPLGSDFPWQSFIPNYSGYLSQVDFYIHEGLTFSGGNFMIYDGTGVSGTLLHTKAIGSLGGGWQSIDLIEDSISLVKNTTYTIALQDTASASYWFYYHTGNPYSDGIHGIGSTQYSGYDMAFRTYYMADAAISTNILTVNSSSSDNITYNLSNIDTLHFSDGTSQSSASYNITQNIKLNDFWLTNDGDNEGIQINNDGAVGIGTSPTNGKLEINGSIDNVINGYTYVSNVNSTTAYVSSNTDPKEVSIYASDRIVGKFVISLSDERIKDIQGISDSEKDLAILNQIEITDYEFIDKVREGNTQQKKVIAQQVAEVFPQAVEKQITEIIPDIYQTAMMDENGWIAFENFELGITNYTLKAGEKVQILFEDRKELLEVLEVNENTFRVEQLATDNWQQATVFVYGRQVHDFHTVDYQAISMLNVSATQQLAKENEQLKKRVAELENQVSKINQLEAMLEELQVQLAPKTRMTSED